MSRIRNIGELLVYHSDEEDVDLFGRISGWPCVFLIRLDQPIQVPQEILRYINESWSNCDDAPVCDIDEFTEYTQINIESGEIVHLNRFITHPRVDTDRFSSMVPHVIVDAFKAQTAYKDITIGLFYDRNNRSEGSNLLDVLIVTHLPEKLKNEDRFLHAFSRKLNKWLADNNKKLLAEKC